MSAGLFAGLLFTGFVKVCCLSVRLPQSARLRLGQLGLLGCLAGSCLAPARLLQGLSTRLGSVCPHLASVRLSAVPIACSLSPSAHWVPSAPACHTSCSLPGFCLPGLGSRLLPVWAIAQGLGCPVRLACLPLLLGCCLPGLLGPQYHNNVRPSQYNVWAGLSVSLAGLSGLSGQLGLGLSAVRLGPGLGWAHPSKVCCPGCLATIVWAVK